MKVLITGATGLVGREIVKLCKQQNIAVHYLTTSKEKIQSETLVKGFYWNTKKHQIDALCLKGVTAIINLAGATIAQRWTQSNKKAILNSRIDSIKTLYKVLKENKHTVEYFVSASALGIYPSSFTERYTEESHKISDSFLGQVVTAWEAEADTIKFLGIPVGKVRTGIVLSKEAGALQKMLLPVKYYVGAALGSGKQWQSWIHLSDMAGLYLFLIKEKLPGVFNAVSSEPVTNAVLTKKIAKTLNNPLWLPNIPSFMLKLILGDMAAVVLESQYLENEKIKDAGYKFKFTQLEPTLCNLLT
ncbi:MAG: TIGR01777 family protein [Flavobacteriales bacterium]|nr:MAG: TIGR01777 family protein [Flavobacteriales bacterium]